MMKTKLKKLTFIFTILLLNSCSNNDDTITDDIIDANYSELVDKWWEDSGDFLADIYFSSNGTYNQKVELLGNVLTSTGDWTWEDESLGIIKVSNLTGNGQLVSEVWFEITNLTETTLNIKQSTDNIDYTIAYLYLNDNIIIDKWWYDTNNFGGDFQFLEDGTFLLGTNSGVWIWIDEDLDILKTTVNGSEQWIKFVEINENTITFLYSQNGIDYSTSLYEYQDTDI